MKIIKESINDASKELNDFLKQFHDCNYVVYGDLVTFDYDGDEKDFNLKNLEDIYFDLPKKETLDLNRSASSYKYIDGEISSTSWGDAFNEINKNLRYAPELELVSDFEYERRKEIFWQLAQKHFKFPSDFVYKHEAYYPSYFHFYVMWGFCYIFLKDGKGLVLHAGASD